MRKGSITNRLLVVLAALVLLVLPLVGACAKPGPAPASPTQPAQSPAPKAAPTVAPSPAPKATPTPAAPKAINLKISGHYAVGITSEMRHVGYFISRLKELGKDRITIEYFPAQSLVKTETVLDAIQTGIVDIADSIPNFYEASIPLVGAVNLPFLWSACSAKERQIYQTELFWKNPSLDKAYAKRGGKVLFCWAGTDTTFFMKKQINKLDDMKGLRIRGAGSMHAGVIKAAGAVPHVMNPAEVYLALQTGVLDGCLIPMSSLFDRKLYEVTKHAISNVESSSAGGPILMRIESWNKLPSDVQKIILQAAKEADQYNLDTSIKENEKMYVDAKAVGMIFTDLPKADMEKWKQNCQPVYDEWLKKAGADGKEMLDLLRKGITEKCRG